jgi:hypothetical protein
MPISPLGLVLFTLFLLSVAIGAWAVALIGDKTLRRALHPFPPSSPSQIVGMFLGAAVLIMGMYFFQAVITSIGSGFVILYTGGMPSQAFMLCFRLPAIAFLFIANRYIITVMSRKSGGGVADTENPFAPPAPAIPPGASERTRVFVATDGPLQGFYVIPPARTEPVLVLMNVEGIEVPVGTNGRPYSYLREYASNVNSVKKYTGYWITLRAAVDLGLKRKDILS